MKDLWIKETMELLEGCERQKTNVEDRIEALEEELDGLDDILTAGSALIRAYMEKHNYAPPSLQGTDLRNLANMSYPEMLIEIARKRQGYLKVSDAVDILLEANISRDKRLIQANIYSALRRMSKRFIKISPGEYRYTNHEAKGDGKPSGIRQAVKKLKEKNPQMTKKDVLDYLIKGGFDFKGKKPTNAVNITWAYLGYANQEKQPKLRIMSMAEAFENLKRSGN